MVDIASISSGDGSPSRLQKGQMLVSWFTPRELTCGYLLTSRPRVWIHTSTHPHMYTSTLFLFLLYLEWWETVIFFKSNFLFNQHIEVFKEIERWGVFWLLFYTYWYQQEQDHFRFFWRGRNCRRHWFMVIISSSVSISVLPGISSPETPESQELAFSLWFIFTSFHFT